MNILKSIFLIVGLFSLAAITTNAYYADRATLTNNQFSTVSGGNNNDNGNNNNNNGNDGNNNNDILKICHATGQSDNFQSITLDENGIISGHAGESHHDGKDIIPPFDYGNPAINFVGQNWNIANIEIYNNDCEALPSASSVTSTRE